MKKVFLGLLVVALFSTQISISASAKTNAKSKKEKASNVDKDKNSIPDVWQQKYKLGIGKDVAKKDKDKDGLSNIVEYCLGLNPTLKDTDKDKVYDGKEDADSDRLNNVQEIELKTNFLSADTDDDGITDACEDKDEDGLDNELEFELEYNPSDADSDNDGVFDGEEDYDDDGIANSSELHKLKIKIVDQNKRKFSLEYEITKKGVKKKVKDQIGIGDIDSFIENLQITSFMTKDQIIAKIKEITGISNPKEIELEINFGNGCDHNSDSKDYEDDNGENDDDQ